MRAIAVAVLLAVTAHAADIPVAAKTLLLKNSGNSLRAVQKTKFAAVDPAVTMAAGTDPAQFGVRFIVMYGTWYGKGQWSAPPGAPGWVPTSAGAKFRYVDFGHPWLHPKRLAIARGRRLLLSTPELGPMWQEIFPGGAGDPNGPVYTAYCVTNAGEEHCHCTEFSTCTWTQAPSPDFSAKLHCTQGIGDPLCHASCADAVDQGATMLDACSGLEWEKKDTVAGSGVDPSNPHDVDNRYTWAGRCSLDEAVLCQPTPAAAALCATQTGGASGCGECGAGQGTCDAALDGAITTVWDWLEGLNAAGFGGHADWRLPTGGAGGATASSPLVPGPAEISSLGQHLQSGEWRAPAALGPLPSASHWTSTTSPVDDLTAFTNFMGANGRVFVSGGGPTPKLSPLAVRAVRAAP